MNIGSGDIMREFAREMAEELPGDGSAASRSHDAPAQSIGTPAGDFGHAGGPTGDDFDFASYLNSLATSASIVLPVAKDRWQTIPDVSSLMSLLHIVPARAR